MLNRLVICGLLVAGALNYVPGTRGVEKSALETKALNIQNTKEIQVASRTGHVPHYVPKTRQESQEVQTKAVTSQKIDASKEKEDTPKLTRMQKMKAAAAKATAKAKDMALKAKKLAKEKQQAAMAKAKTAAKAAKNKFAIAAKKSKEIAGAATAATVGALSKVGKNAPPLPDPNGPTVVGSVTSGPKLDAKTSKKAPAVLAALAVRSNLSNGHRNPDVRTARKRGKIVAPRSRTTTRKIVRPQRKRLRYAAYTRKNVSKPASYLPPSERVKKARAAHIKRGRAAQRRKLAKAKKQRRLAKKRTRIKKRNRARTYRAKRRYKRVKSTYSLGKPRRYKRRVIFWY